MSFGAGVSGSVRRLLIQNTGDYLQCDEVDWQAAKHVKWWVVRIGEQGMERKRFLNLSGVLFEDYVGIRGARIDDFESYLNVTRVMYEV